MIRSHALIVSVTVSVVCASVAAAPKYGTPLAEASGDMVAMVQRVTRIDSVGESTRESGANIQSASKTVPGPAPLSLPRKAITFEGNGWLATAAYTALISGFQRALQRRDGRRLDDLLSTFDAVVSVSGGSWYSALLIYSSKYLALQNEIASDPDNAAELWNSSLMVPFLSGCAGEVPPTQQARLRQAKARLQATRQQSNAALSAGAIERIYDRLEYELLCSTRSPDTGNNDWSTYVGNILRQMMPLDIKAGTNSANAWAMGKEWMPTTAFMQPGDPVFSKDAVYVSVRDATGPMLSYQGANSANRSSWPLFFPATFSVVVGGGSQAPSPHPFCADGVCLGQRLDYIYDNGEPVNKSGPSGKYTRLPSPQLSDFFADAFGRQGSLSVSDMVTASSAHAGVLAMHPPAGRDGNGSALYTIDDARFATWVASAPPGGTFDRGRGLTEEAFQRYGEFGMAETAASSSLQALIDGAYTDNTGIVSAVSSGAETVVAFFTDNSSDFRSLFQGTDPFSGPLTYVGGNLHIHKIFAQDLAQIAVQAAENTFMSLRLVPDARWVGAISFYTLFLTTADDPWSGVVAGRNITVHVLDVAPINRMGNLHLPLYDYSTYLGEIARSMALPDNAPILDSALERIFSVV